MISRYKPSIETCFDKERWYIRMSHGAGRSHLSILQTRECHTCYVLFLVLIACWKFWRIKSTIAHEHVWQSATRCCRGIRATHKMRAVRLQLIDSTAWMLYCTFWYSECTIFVRWRTENQLNVRILSLLYISAIWQYKLSHCFVEPS